MKQLLLFAALLIGSLSVQAQSIEASRDSMAADNLNYQVDLAIRYLFGDGVERNWEKSFDLLKKSAEQGYPDALDMLALCYLNGWGTQKSQDKAIQCLEELKQGQDESTIQGIDEAIAMINEGDTLSAYEFQFRILPQWLAGYADGSIDEEQLIDLELLRLKMGLWNFITHYECDLDSLSISTHQIDDSITVHVIHMPDPSRPPLCKYAAYVLDKKNGLSRYYTLEKTYDFFDESGVADPYVVGGMAIGNDKVNGASSHSDYPDGFSHLNFGWLEGKPTEENFVNTILRLFKGK